MPLCSGAGVKNSVSENAAKNKVDENGFSGHPLRRGSHYPFGESNTVSKQIESMTMKPSETAVAIRAMIPTQVSLFLWGPPGISKSQVSSQVATSLGIAFIDVRLSQMDPTDLRGIPFPVIINGEHGVRWSPPLVLPRDLNLIETRETNYAETIVFEFSGLNPEGSNGIRYITDPKFDVRCVGGKGEARIVSKSATRVEVGIYDGETLVPGAVRFHVTGKARAIIALEEFNSAPPSVQAAAYQLVLDRRLGEYVVPEGAYLMGMGNRDTDKGVTFKMPTPIMNRFDHIEMVTNFDDWQAWALDRGIHAQVVGYLSAFKESLFRFDAGTAARGFPTPRSWEFVSKILQANEFLSEQIAIGLVTGAIGDAEGAKFMAFRKIAHELPRAEEILNGTLVTMKKKVEVQLAYALTTTLCYELRERAEKIKRLGEGWRKSPEFKKWLSESNNFLMFIMENFSPEICVMGARAAIAIHKLPFDTKAMSHFDTFANRFKDLIVPSS